MNARPSSPRGLRKRGDDGRPKPPRTEASRSASPDGQGKADGHCGQVAALSHGVVDSNSYLAPFEVAVDWSIGCHLRLELRCQPVSNGQLCRLVHRFLRSCPSFPVVLLVWENFPRTVKVRGKLSHVNGITRRNVVKISTWLKQKEKRDAAGHLPEIDRQLATNSSPDRPPPDRSWRPVSLRLQRPA